MEKRSTYRSNTYEFIEKARKVHGDKYDYSKVEYVNNKTKVCIICPEHGEFWQSPNMHLRRNGCPLCSKIINNEMLHNNGEKQKLTTDEFIKRAKIIHGDKYDYSKSIYVNNYTKIEIICPIHGSFFQTPANHLNNSGCPKCSFEKQKLGKIDFICKAKKIHGNKYNYSKSEYRNNHTKLCIVCPEHGEFWQTPNSHLNGSGCYECARKNFGKYNLLTKENILEKFKIVHGDRYDYSKFEYFGYDKKSEIICKEHGSFFITPHSHIHGIGCKQCANKYLVGESKLKKLLEAHFNDVIYQAKKDDYNLKWLGKQSLDFFIPSLNVAIEYQGEQHFKPIKYWGGNDKFSYTRKLDIEKNRKASENNVNIIYFRYGNIDVGDFPYNVIFDENKLLNILQEKNI